MIVIVGQKKTCCLFVGALKQRKMSQSATSTEGVLIDDVFAAEPVRPTDSATPVVENDEKTEFAALQRALRTEGGAIDLNEGDYVSSVALFVYAGKHSAPPEQEDPLAQVMQSTDKQHWYVFESATQNAPSGDASDCRAPLIHFDVDEMPVCHRRIDRADVGEAIYLAMWLAAQSEPSATHVSAFATNYKVFHDQRETPDAAVVARAVLSTAGILSQDQENDKASEDNAFGEQGNGQHSDFERKSVGPVPEPTSRAWLLWLIGGTLIVLIAAVTLYFVMLRRKATQNGAQTLTRAPKSAADQKIHMDDLARSSAAEDSGRGAAATPLLGNV